MTPGLVAATVVESGGLPVMLVNVRGRASRSTGSLRSTLAHELAHVLVDAGVDGNTHHMTASQPSALRSDAFDRIEQRANGFAPAFLAPPAVFRARWEAEADLAQQAALCANVATEWGLTFEGAVWHVKNAAPVSPNRAA